MFCCGGFMGKKKKRKKKGHYCIYRLMSLISLQKGRSVIAIDNNNNKKATPTRHLLPRGSRRVFLSYQISERLRKGITPSFRLSVKLDKFDYGK